MTALEKAQQKKESHLSNTLTINRGSDDSGKFDRSVKIEEQREESRLTQIMKSKITSVFTQLHPSGRQSANSQLRDSQLLRPTPTEELLYHHSFTPVHRTNFFNLYILNSTINSIDRLSNLSEYLSKTKTSALFSTSKVASLQPL